MRALVLKGLHYLNSKSAAFALGIAAFALLANLLLAASYVMELREQEVLVSEIEASRQSIAEYSRPLTVQRLLAEADVALAAEQRAFPRQASGSEVTGKLLNLARDQGLTVIETSTRPGESRHVGQHTYRALAVSVQVAGNQPALQSFLHQLDKGALPGARIEEVSIRSTVFSNTHVLNGHPEDQGLNSSDPTLVASLAVSVYQQQEGAD